MTLTKTILELPIKNAISDSDDFYFEIQMADGGTGSSRSLEHSVLFSRIQAILYGAENTWNVTQTFTVAPVFTDQSGTKAALNLDNVDNTSDVDKPVSTAQAAADADTLASANSYTDDSIATEVSDRMAADDLLVPKTTSVNGHALSTDITISATDISDFDTKVRTSRLDQMALPNTNLFLNGNRLTGVADAISFNDAVVLGQLPTSLPPSGAAGGALKDTYPNPNIKNWNTGNSNSIGYEVWWQAVGLPSDVGVHIIPKGAGHFALGAAPDGTLVGGNARGKQAVDLQLARGVATEVASGDYSVAIGISNTAYGKSSVAIGNTAGAYGLYSCAVGYHSQAYLDHSFAIGSNAKALAAKSFAVGYNAYVKSSYSGADAFGYNAIADRNNSFAIGKVGGERQIIHVADGTDPHDAATVGQIPTNLPPSGSAGGDLTGTYPNPTLKTTLSGAHTWSNAQTFTVAPVFTDASGTRTAIGLGSVENTALSTWAGSTNITTLGTIGTGIWNGTVIADGKIASALTGKTYNGLTLSSVVTGFTIAGGTSSKTLTLDDNLTVSALRQYPSRAVNPSGTYGLPFAGIPFANTSSGVGNSTLYACIGYVTKPVTLSNPVVCVTTGVASAVARCGIVQWDSVNEQSTGAPLVDWGTADCSVNSSAPTFSNGSATVTLQPGVLYAVLFGTSGGASPPTFSYLRHIPIGIDIITVSGASGPSLLTDYKLTLQSAQITGGFSSTPMLSPTRDVAAAPGLRNFVLFSIS